MEYSLNASITESRGRFKQVEDRLSSIKTHCNSMGAWMKNMEVQIGQLATSIKEQYSGKFPSDTEPNPKECKAITLRSGKKIEGDNPCE